MNASSAQLKVTLPQQQQQQQQIIRLLQACIQCVHSGVFHPVVYQAMSALHQYSMMSLHTKSSHPRDVIGCQDGASRPAFCLVSRDLEDPNDDGEMEEKHPDVVCYGWMEQLSNNVKDDDHDDDGDVPRWRSVLALLIQKDKKEGPCLRIAREVMTTSSSGNAGNPHHGHGPSTELETLHHIPVSQRLISCRYHDFYGNHRILLTLRNTRHRHDDIMWLQCPTAHDAQQWVQRLVPWCQPPPHQKDALSLDDVQVETVDRKSHHVVIHDDPMGMPTFARSLPLSSEPGVPNDTKRMAPHELPPQHKAVHTDPTRLEREQQARRKGEEARRKRELEYEREKLERERRRREELEVQRQRAREEQRKLDQERKKKFLEAEEKKERLKAQAAAEAAAKSHQGVPKSTSIKPAAAAAVAKQPQQTAETKPLAVSARSTTGNTQGSGGSSSHQHNPTVSADSSPQTTKVGDKESLWFSLDQQMSAFEAADAERRKAEEAKKREEEETRKKKLGLDETMDDPEEARRRIAEQARQRLVQEEAGRRKVEDFAKTEPAKQEEAISPLPQYAQQHQAAHQRSHSNPAPAQHQQQQQNHQHYQQHASYNHWQQQQQQQQQQEHPNSNAYHNAPRTPQPRYNTNQPHQYPQHQQQYHQPAQHNPSQPSNPSPPYQPRQAPQQQQLPHPHQRSAHPPPPANPNQSYPRPHQQQQQQQHPLGSNEKYAAMANQSDDGHAATTRIKHAILVHWALLPPQLHILRPIDVLLTTIHQVFPPALGVPGHDYFSKWNPLTRTEVANEERLKKSVRKLRFFLHPDKLPRDFSDEQHFTCKLLWDVTNDAFEDYKKGKEDLDWV